jgi:hypothetical protein
MRSLVRPELPTASVGSSQAPTAAVDNSAPSATRPKSTYRSGKAVQTNGATSGGDVNGAISREGLAGLPLRCHVVIPGLPAGGNVAVCERGASGVRMTSIDLGGFSTARRLVRALNDTLGIDAAAEHAMLVGWPWMLGIGSLDDDINKHLPFKVTNPSFPNESITLRQLATHTSSITDRGSVYAGAYHFGRDSPETLGEFLHDYFASGGKNYSKENFLDAKPGRHREYSNIAAALAGYIVELAVGEKFNAYTRRTIFAPLKMDDTGWLMSEVDLTRHSNLYIAQGLALPIELYGLSTYPDGGLRTSVEDLSRFFIALLNDGAFDGVRILQTNSVDEMLRFQYGAANRPDNVELSGAGSANSGIFWATKESLTRIGHNGADPGLVTMMPSDVDKKIGVILFVNTPTRQEDGAA